MELPRIVVELLSIPFSRDSGVHWKEVGSFAE
jgi:hypothetical protein